MAWGTSSSGTSSGRVCSLRSSTVRRTTLWPSGRGVEAELRLHDPALLDRPMRMVVTKQDLPEVRRRWPQLRTALAPGERPRRCPPARGVGPRGTGLDALRTRWPRRRSARCMRGRRSRRLRVHRFDPLDEGWQVEAEDDRCGSVDGASNEAGHGPISTIPSHATGSSDSSSASGSTRSCAARAPRKGARSASARPSSSGVTSERGVRSASVSWAAPSTRRTWATCGWPRWSPTRSSSSAFSSCRPPNPRTRWATRYRARTTGWR